MGRLQDVFTRLSQRGDGVLVGFIEGGDPHPEYTEKIAETLVKGGVDVLELGIPFSDPIADGPSIQASSQRALKAGTTPDMVLELAHRVKKANDVPVVLLTYYNIIYQKTAEEFIERACESRVDGVVVPDLPVDEADHYREVARSRGVDTVFLVTPSTSIPRLNRIINYTSGFLYLVSVFGVTGARSRVEEITINSLHRFKPHTSGRIPLAVGFGVSKPEHASLLVKHGADGVIVGSAFCDIIGRHLSEEAEMLEELKGLSNGLKKALSRGYAGSEEL